MIKKILFVLLAVCTILSAMADNEKPIDINLLPAKAQEVIRTHFKEKTIALAKMDTSIFEKSYDVIFTDGDKIEFSRSGEWQSIKCRKDNVPVRLIPTEIRNYLNKNYPNVDVKSIEKEKDKTEVELSNQISIKFNKDFKVIDIDND